MTQYRDPNEKQEQQSKSGSKSGTFKRPDVEPESTEHKDEPPPPPPSHLPEQSDPTQPTTGSVEAIKEGEDPGADNDRDSAADV